MLFLEAELAVYKRLTGAPLDSKGRPLLDSTTGIPVNRSRVMPPEAGGGMGPSYGIQIPLMQHPHDTMHGLTSKDPNSLPLFDGVSDTLMQVPVFDENVEGRKWADIAPSVTFKWTSESFDPSVYMFYDPFNTFDTTSTPVNIANRNGDVIDSGYSTRLVRPNPDSYKVQYTIVASAKTLMELGFICAQILYLFPAKGAIEVEFMSGETHVCDMFLTNIMNQDPMSADIAMSFGMQEQRWYKRAYTYEIETYVDNTMNKYGMREIYSQSNLIRQRILQIGDLQRAVMQTWDMNKLELELTS